MTAAWRLLGSVPVLFGVSSVLDTLQSVAAIVASVAATVGAITAWRATRRISKMEEPPES